MQTLVYSLLILTILIGNVYAELPEDIVFLATFDDGNGDTLTDLSGHGNDGTVEGKASWIDGEFDKGFEFDGGTFITVENAGPLKELTDPMSVGAWVNPDSITGWQNIVEMDGGAGWKFGFHGSKKLVWTTYHVKDFIGQTTIAEGEWSHVAATWDGKEAIILGFLKSPQKPLSIRVLSMRGYENAKKCSLICPHYVKNTPYFRYKIE